MVSPPSRMPHILLFGPPGAGKSTQAELLAQDWPILTISTGKLLREEVAAGTVLGNKVSKVLSRGDLVEDSVIVAILTAWLAALPPDRGFLLDGFPRTLAQAEALDTILAELYRPLTAVIQLDLAVEDAVHRLGGRRICHGADPEEIIHIDDDAAIDRCLARGGLLVQRPDDLPRAIVRRFEVYRSETEPLIAFYDRRGIAHAVDASDEPHKIAERVNAILRAAQA